MNSSLSILFEDSPSKVESRLTGVLNMFDGRRYFRVNKSRYKKDRMLEGAKSYAVIINQALTEAATFVGNGNFRQGVRSSLELIASSDQALEAAKAFVPDERTGRGPRSLLLKEEWVEAAKKLSGGFLTTGVKAAVYYAASLKREGLL